MIQELGVGLCVPTLDPGGSRSPRASDSGNWQASRPNRRSEGQSCGQPRGGGSCPREKAAGVLPPSFSPRCVCAATSRPVQRRERDGCRHRIPRGAPLCSFLWEPFSAVRRPHLFRAGPEGVPPPPPAPVGDKVSASPGSGRMQRAHASLQASVISPARHGRFCSSAAPKPRNLVRKEMVCLTPASNGRTNPIIFYREIAISLLAAESTQISNAQLGGQAHRLDGPSGTRGSPPVPRRHLHSAARARGPGQAGTQA